MDLGHRKDTASPDITELTEAVIDHGVMNTNARKRHFKKCLVQQKQLCVYLVFGC